MHVARDPYKDDGHSDISVIKKGTIFLASLFWGLRSGHFDN